MDYNDTYEQEIDLKELMFAVLHKWKTILAAAVVLALILGGYKGISGYRHESDQSVIDKAQENYENELEFYNKNLASCEREIENLEKDITRQQEYLEDSVLMNISPYDIWEAKAELFVKTDYEIMPDMVYQNIDLTGTVLQSYRSALNGADFIEKISNNVGMESQYLQELVEITIGRDDNNTKLNNLLIIRVRCGEEATAQKILDDILDGIPQFRTQIQSVVGTHTISEVNRSLGAKVDLALAELQRKESERLTTLNNALNVKKDELTKMEEPAPVSASFGGVIKSAVKYALIGGVLGAFMVVFFVCVGFVMSDRVYSGKELKYRFKVKLLGTLSVAGSKKEGKIDAWLSRMEGRGQNNDMNVEYGLIAANISNYAGTTVRSLLIVGGAGEELLNRVASELTGRLSGMKVIYGGNLLNDAEGLKKLPECDGVILVEQCGKSLYSNVELEIEKTCDMDKKVIGCVVFE
ncbi:MAG: hemagglutinin [Hungatella sp.]|nr:hemagglutinin [Hungatella sp.]